MRYVEITHTYVLPVPTDEFDTIDPAINAGVSAMENFMRARARNIMALRSDWKLMPKDYFPQVMETEFPDEPDAVKFIGTIGALGPQRQDSEQAKQMIEADLDEGISFTRDVMGQDSQSPPHPWNQGLRVLPADHPMFHAETIALQQQKRLCGYFDGEKDAICVAPAGHPGDHMWAPVAEMPELEQ